jgi:hypothetical protein
MKVTKSYKNKLYLLLLSSLVFLMICYNLAFKNTIYEINSFKKNSRQLISLQDAPLQLQLLDKRLKDLEGSFSYGPQSENNLEVLLLGKATSLIRSSDLKITELPKNDIYTKDGFVVNTQQIVIQGSFIELVIFLHSIGSDRTIGNICSVDFYSQKEVQTGINSLKMKIYFQTIIQDKKQ